MSRARGGLPRAINVWINPDRLALPLSFLHHHAQAPEGWRVRALSPRYVEMNRLPKKVVDAKAALRALPPAARPAEPAAPSAEAGKGERTTGLAQLTQSGGQPVRIALKVGDGVNLPDGKGSIQLDGWVRWVKLQVGATPGVPISLIALGFAVAGMCLSLFVRPRRVWIKVRGGEAGRRVVEIGGLDRADARAGLTEDVAELAAEVSRPEDVNAT